MCFDGLLPHLKQAIQSKNIQAGVCVLAIRIREEPQTVRKAFKQCPHALVSSEEILVGKTCMHRLVPLVRIDFMAGCLQNPKPSNPAETQCFYVKGCDTCGSRLDMCRIPGRSKHHTKSQQHRKAYVYASCHVYEGSVRREMKLCDMLSGPCLTQIPFPRDNRASMLLRDCPTRRLLVLCTAST